MKPVKYSIVLMVVIFISIQLSGCAAKTLDKYSFQLPENKFSLSPTKFKPEEIGVVFGSITQQRDPTAETGNDAGLGRFAIFGKQGTYTPYISTNNKYFAFQLPQGSYELIALGAPYGYIGPNAEPFRFSIKGGEIKYVGAVVGSRDLRWYMEKRNRPKEDLTNEIKARKPYGPGLYDGSLVGRPTYRAGKNYFYLYVLDESDSCIPKFIEDLPQFKGKVPIIELMQ